MIRVSLLATCQIPSFFKFWEPCPVDFELAPVALWVETYKNDKYNVQGSWNML